MTKLSQHAREICVNPRSPKEGLKQRPNGTWELVKKYNGRAKSFSSKDPVLVWEKYAEFLEDRDESKIDTEIQRAESTYGPKFEEVAGKYKDSVLLMKIGTQRSYLPCIKRAVDEFGERRMKEIQAWEIKAFLNMPMARTTVCNQKTVINSIYQLYIDDKEWHGDYNPSVLTSIPKGLKKTRREPPSSEQILAVKNAAKNPGPDDLIAIVYLCTGGRRGEGCAIQFKNIDWDEGIINIPRAVEWNHNQPYFTKTKTEAGIRQLPLLKMMRDALSKYRDKYSPDTFIIGLEEKPVTNTWYERHWASLWRTYGFAHCIEYKTKRFRDGKEYSTKNKYWKSDVCAHQFRHEYVCMLCLAGVKEEVAIQIIGHTNAKMVHEVYMHLKPSMIQDATKLMDAYLTKKG